jgi:hypothetical protein
MIFYLDNKPLHRELKKTPTKPEIFKWCNQVKQLQLFPKYEVWIWGSSTNTVMEYGMNWRGDFDVVVVSKHFDLKEIAIFLHECFNIAVDLGFIMDISYRVVYPKHIIPWKLEGTTFVNLNTNETFEDLKAKDRYKFIGMFTFELLIPFGSITAGEPKSPFNVDKWWEHRTDNKKVHLLYGKDQILHNLWRSRARYPGVKWWKRHFGSIEPLYHPPVNIMEL